jgi:hypothetical protein
MAIIHMPQPTAPKDRIEATLRRRLDAAIEARLAAAIQPDGTAAFHAWLRARERAAKLTRFLLAHYYSRSPKTLQ